MLYRPPYQMPSKLSFDEIWLNFWNHQRLNDGQLFTQQRHRKIYLCLLSYFHVIFSYFLSLLVHF